MVVDPRGLSDPLSIAEKPATFVAGRVMTTGAGVAVAVGVGVWVGAVLVWVSDPSSRAVSPAGVQIAAV